MFITDNKRSNSFDNDQNVLAFYNSYQYNLKNWGFKGGLLLEQTVIDAEKAFSQNYTNLTPSFSINRKLKNMSSLTLGYSQRIQRPGIYQLNPFIDRSKPNFETCGNPNLRPMTANSIELKYSRFKKASINVGLGYDFFNKLIMPTANGFAGYGFV